MKGVIHTYVGKPRHSRRRHAFFTLLFLLQIPFSSHDRSQPVHKFQDICRLESETHVIAITIGETETNGTCVSLMSEYQNCLLCSSMSKTDENVRSSERIWLRNRRIYVFEFVNEWKFCVDQSRAL